MKKLIAILMAALMCMLPLVSLAEVELTMGSWRTEDTAQVQALLDQYYEMTGVKITFLPTSAATRSPA